MLFNMKGPGDCLTERNIIWHPLYVESNKKWYKWTYLQNRNRLIDLEKELMAARREGCGEGIIRQLGMDMYTLVYLKWTTNKVVLYSTGNSAQFYVAAWIGGELGGEWMYIYDWVPLLSTWKHHNIINWLYAQVLSCVWLFAIPWSVACRAPLFMGFFQASILE